MICTDEDLKRFQEVDYQPPGIDSWVQIKVRELKALLVGLEAAEGLIVYAVCRCGTGASCHCGYWDKKEN